MKSILGMLLCLMAACSVCHAQTADTIYTNGKIYTVNESQPWAEAVAIKDGKFVAVGSNADVEKLKDDQTQVVDLGGKFVMPGFTDAHLHPQIAFIHEESGRLLFDATSAKEVKEGLLAYTKENPGDGWIRAEKFRLGAFPDGKTNRQWIDAIIPDRPVYLVDETGHNAVANTKALELAGITKDTPDPKGGSIERDSETGEPTGYLSETGMRSVASLLPAFTKDATIRAIERSFAEFRAFGITSFIDMFAYPGSLEAYREIEKDGGMTFRISAAMALNEYTDEYVKIPDAVEAYKHAADFDTKLVKVDSFKYWADGTPISHTALLVEDYADRPDKGEHTLLPDQKKLARELLDQGKIGRFHSIGDGTTRMILDMVEASRQENPQNKRPVHIGHCLMVHADDLSRFKALNVIAEMSPAFWFPLPVNEILPKHIGKARAARAMPIAELHRAGATVCIGTDWPAGTPSPDPFRGLEGLVTRMDPWDDYPGKLGEPVSLEIAIKMMTLNGAKAMEMDDELGSIESGKHADMIILDRNLFEVSPHRISETEVLQTVFAGKVVYDSSKDAGPMTRQAFILKPLKHEAMTLLGGCAECARAYRQAQLAISGR